MLAVGVFHHFDVEKNLELPRRRSASAELGACLMVADLGPDQNPEAGSTAPMLVLRGLHLTPKGDAPSERASTPKPALSGNLEPREVAPPRPIVARR
jgi:hypothetical protein